MNAVDAVFLGVLLLSMLIGAWRGLVYEVLSVFVWVGAFVLAQWFAPSLAAILPMTGAVQSLRYVLAFIVIFVGTAFVAGLITQMVKKLITAIGLRPVDRTLGAVFGLFRGVILLLAMAIVVNMTQWHQQMDWKNSQGASVLTDVLTRLKPLLPQEFGKYLP